VHIHHRINENFRSRPGLDHLSRLGLCVVERFSCTKLKDPQPSMHVASSLCKNLT